MKATIAGEEVELLADRALWWPRRSALFIADLHLGKAETFQRYGVPVPSDFGVAELRRLRETIISKEVGEVWVLGDMIHDIDALVPETSAAFVEMREATAGTEFHLVRGNHDRHVLQLPAAWRIHEHREPFQLDPFALRHHPGSGDGYVLAGHLHPKFVARGAGDSLALPCFHFGPDGGLLPAFTEFSSGVTVASESGRVFVVVDGEVVGL